jgi:hypothetical protein
MNALQSYLRHLIVTGLVLAVEKTKFPLEGAAEAADVIALAVLGSLTWLVAKYGPVLARKTGLLPLVLLAAVLCLPSCGIPLKATLRLEEGALSYSSKGGLEMAYAPGHGEMPAIYRSAK